MSTRLLVLVSMLLLAAAAAAATMQHPGEDQATCKPGDRGVIKAYLCVAARQAWQEIIRGFERKTCIRVEAVYGASGRLLAQLEASRDGDVYAPASPVYMEKAVRKGIVDPDTVAPAAYLEPAILVPRGNPAGVESLRDLARPGIRVALGDPRSVAVGTYAKEMLERLGLWENVSRNAVYASSFAQLVAMVASGSVDAAIGWSVAAHQLPGRIEAIPIPGNATLGPSPVPIGVTSFSRNPEAARLFIEYVRSREAREAWLRSGYTPAGG